MAEEEGEKSQKAIQQDDFLSEAKGFFELYKDSYRQKKGNKIIKIDFNDLSEYSPQLSEMLIEKPDETIQLLEVALEELAWAPNNARARFTSISPTQEVFIRRIRAKHLSRFIGIEGIVRQASEVRPQVVNAKFECPSCGSIIYLLQIDKKFREPTRCSCGRRGGFKVLSKDMVDAQAIVIEEAPENLEGGEQPKRMTIFLKEDLVDPRMEMRTTPGSRVKILGVLKEIALSSSSGAMLTRFDLAIEANNVIPMEETFDDIQINEEDEMAIRELAADPNILDRFIKSTAPSIWGHEKVKKALALQLFGGVKKNRSDGTPMRGDIHILLVGDPGVAKSVLLGFIASVAPKSRYVAGKSATGAGLTATVVRDEFLRGWSLEAGAIVLANKGLVCIDEFDKMNEEDRSSMHEAMEQQCMLPDFKLMLSNGKEVEIGKFVDDLMEKNKDEVYAGRDCEILPVDDVKLISTDFSKHFSLKADRISRHLAPKNFVKIELSDGKEIIVTPEHPCWITKDGKIITIPAEELNAGEYFPIASEIQIEEEEYKIENDYLCKILGYHLSDGCYELNRGKKTGIQFCNNDRDLIKDYKSSIESFFDLKPGITKRGKQFSVRVISKKVADYFYKLDKSLMEKGEFKKIPDKIFSLPKENLKYLLRALFDGDGTVINQVRNGCRIGFVSQNRILANQISGLLLRFGILSSIFKDKNVFRLDISGQENLSNFLNSVSFLSHHKEQRLKQYCAKGKTYRTIKDVIPNCTDKINGIFRKLKISARKEIGHSIDLGVEKQRLFLQKLVLIAEKYALKQNKKEILEEINDIKRLAFGYARWMKIKKVSKIKNEGIKWVYDVTIEPYHTFISNGMILHNTVTISKATVQATLRAQTSILAAANPKYGRFDPSQSIPKQVDLLPSLLSRFDSIFIMRDIPHKQRDESIATHVLQEHKQEVEHDVIDRALIKKYISFAKQKYNPILTDEAIEEIKKFYVNLRNLPQFGDSPNRPSPIGARQLEALVRLAEAHARMKLTKEVTIENARVAIELVKSYLMEVGYDEETKTIDIDRISGNPASQRNRIAIIRETLEDLEKKLGKLIPYGELEKALEGKMKPEDLDEVVGKLLKSGDLFRPRRGYIQRM